MSNVDSVRGSVMNIPQATKPISLLAPKTKHMRDTNPKPIKKVSAETIKENEFTLAKDSDIDTFQKLCIFQIMTLS